MARQIIGISRIESFDIEVTDAFASLYLYEHGFKNTQEELDYSSYGQRFPDNLIVTGDYGSNVSINNLQVTFDGGSGDDNVQLRFSDIWRKHVAHSHLDGGAGNDTLSFDLRASPSNLTFAYGQATTDLLRIPSYPAEMFITYINFEHVNVRSGSGDDEIRGGNGTDRLDGGAGIDLIAGGKGKDILTGGAGIDFFHFDAGDSGVGGANRDIITDFQTGVDRIDLTSMAPDTAFTITDTATGSLIRIDADHSGTYEMQIATTGHVAATDVIFFYT